MFVNHLSLSDMETIPKENCRKIGFIRKTHGIKGEVVLEFDEEFETSIENGNRFFIELDGLLVPFFTENDGIWFKSSKSAILTLKWVDTDAYAKRLVGKTVWMPKDEIMDDYHEFDVFQLKGFTLSDKKNGVIGIIEEISDYSGNIVLTINQNQNELLVPFNNDFLLNADEKEKTILLDLPDGLIGEDLNQ